MKNKFSFIVTLWWVLLMGFLGGMIIWLAPKEDRISEDENRYLAGAPEFSLESVIDGSFMSGVENYLADGFFMRRDLIKISSDITGIFNIKSDEENMNVDMEQAVNEFVSETAEENTDQDISDTTDNISQNAEDAEQDIAQQRDEDSDAKHIFWLDYTDGTRKTVYDYSIENLDISIEALNSYREALPDDGELHFFQIPYGYLANIIINDSYNRYIGWGCNAEEYMQENAVDGVYVHNGAAILEPYLMDREPLYYATDYHWSALGAYYGLEGIRSDMGLPSIGYDDYEYTIWDCYVGHGNLDEGTDEEVTDRLEVMHTLFPVMTSCKIEHMTEESDVPYMYYKHGGYLAYLAGTMGPWRRIETGADTGRVCLVVTDSFGNAFTPYLFPYYDEVFVLDLRPSYYSVLRAGASVREYIEYYDMDDAYIMLSTSSSMNSQYMLEYLLKFLD